MGVDELSEVWRLLLGTRLGDGGKPSSCVNAAQSKNSVENKAGLRHRLIYVRRQYGKELCRRGFSRAYTVDSPKIKGRGAAGLAPGWHAVLEGGAFYKRRSKRGSGLLHAQSEFLLGVFPIKFLLYHGGHQRSIITTRK